MVAQASPRRYWQTIVSLIWLLKYLQVKELLSIGTLTNRTGISAYPSPSFTAKSPGEAYNAGTVRFSGQVSWALHCPERKLHPGNGEAGRRPQWACVF